MTKVLLLSFISGLLIMSLTACDHFSYPKPEIKKHTVTITVVDGVNLPKTEVETQQGYASWYWGADGNNTCVVQLREYPKFLGHEVRHCFEGDWHKGVKNGEDFYD